MKSFCLETCGEECKTCEHVSVSKTCKWIRRWKTSEKRDFLLVFDAQACCLRLRIACSHAYDSPLACVKSFPTNFQAKERLLAV